MNNIDIAFLNADFFARTGTEHIVEIGTNTIYIKPVPDGINFKKLCFTENKLSNSGLQFIRKVRNDVKRNIVGKSIPQFEPKDISYINFNRNLPDVATDAIEVDINGAYWNVARKLDLISEEVYSEGLSVDKEIRLISLGSLASRKTAYRFDGKKYIPLPNIEDKRLRSVFMLVCKELSNIMVRAVEYIGYNPFIMFWVDAFFIRKSCYNALCHFLESEGFEYKTIAVDRLEKVMEDSHEKIVAYMPDGEEKKYSIGSGCSEVCKDVERFVNRFGR